MLSYSISTPVQAPISHVKKLFTADLLIRLSPPFPTVTLQRFDGCKKDDNVVLVINLLFLKVTWSSLITEDLETENEWYFIDQGVKMTFGLQYWQHKHRVQKISEEACEIIDEISFDTCNAFLNYLLYNFLCQRWWLIASLLGRCFFP